MVVSVIMSVYFSCLLAFCFVSHPVVYCVLLLVSSLCVSSVCFLVLGFSWYLALFCLVYIGGVYVLFIFVSIHSPNPLPASGVGTFVPGVFFFLFLCLFFGSSSPLPVLHEQSFFLCSKAEGYSYCLFCLVLMVGFVAISVVASSKDSFFR